MSRISLDPIRRHLETQIFETWHVSPRGLALFRIYFCALALGVLVPSTLWAPPGVPAWYVLLTISLALTGVGWRTPLVSGLAGTSWMLAIGSSFHFGRLDPTLMIACVPLLLARYWGQELSLDARRRRTPPRRMPAWLLALGAWVLSLLLLAAAIPELSSGWQAPSSAVVDRGAALLGAAFVFAVLSPRRFRFLLALSLIFNLSILATKHIPLVAPVVVYGLFAPLSALAERLERSPGFAAASRWFSRRSAAAIAAAALLVAVPLSLLLAGGSLWTREIRLSGLPLPQWPPSLVVLAGGCVGALVLLGRFRDALRELRRHPGILIYDADCAFCTRSALWAERHMQSSEIRAWRDVPALLAAHDLGPDECGSASWWVDGQGRRLRGERAIAKSLVDMGGLRALAGWLIYVPVISWLCAVAYRLIAENRHLMPGGTADCALPAAQVGNPES